MPRPSSTGSRARAIAIVALPVLFIAPLTACSSHGWTYRGGDRHISFGARMDRTSDLETRTVSTTVVPTVGAPLRIRNLAGRVTLVATETDAVGLEAVVHARGRDAGHTAELLDGMVWIQDRDREGRAEWTLAYPAERYSRFHYADATKGFKVTATHSFGPKVTVSSQRAMGAPTLFADLTVSVPRGAAVHLRNLAGNVTGQDLDGLLTLDVTVGAVEIEGSRGELVIDSAGGDVTVHAIDGSMVIDTGAGDVFVAAGSAGRIEVDTGAGDVEIDGGWADEIDVDTGAGDVSVLDVDFVSFNGDTGAGSIFIRSPLVRADRVHADTGAGSVVIETGDDASFNLHADTGVGSVRVGFDDVDVQRHGWGPVRARRGDGRTEIHMDTGAGSCTIRRAG